MKSLRVKVHLKGRSRPLIVELEGEEALFEFGQRSEIVRGEDLSLNDREVDLNLIEPTGVDRSVDEDARWAIGRGSGRRLSGRDERSSCP